MSKQAPVLRRLVRQVRPYSLWVAITVFASLCLAVIDISVGKYIERMVNGSIDSSLQIVLFVTVLMLAGMPCRYVVKYASARFSVKALRDMRRELVLRICDLPVSRVERSLTGDLVSRMTNDMSILQTFFIQHFSELFYLPVVFLGALVVLMITSWKLVLSSLILLPVGMGIAALLTNSMQSKSEQLQVRMGQLNALAHDAISGIAIIKAFNMQTVFFEKYRFLMEQAVKQSLQLEKRYAFLGPVAILFLSAPIVFVIVYGGYLIRQGEINAGDIILFLYLLSFILQPISMMPLLIAQIKEASGAAERLFEMLDWPSERKSNTNDPVDFEKCPVQFDSVTFSYDGKTDVLQGVSFEVMRGETLAIVGASGGGKSTIFKLLNSFYELEPDHGSIKVFGRSLSDWNLSELRGLVSMVSQDSYLFPASFTQNIGYGRLTATLDEIKEAAEAANAHDFIVQLPEGYETLLGERGSGLSGGQKQRIAIARAFLKEAPILLLDEPTSALDSHSEALVQAALKKLMVNRTVIIIAHRLSTILQADRILVLDQGRIVESGRHEELLELDGVYKKLYLHQLSSEDHREEHGSIGEGRSGHVLEAGVL